MKRFIIPAVLGFSLFTACNKNDNLVEWTIFGTIKQLEVQVSEIQHPLEGMKVYLLNLEFSIDTVTGRYRQTDILDSVFTDSEGAYRFDLVIPGDYVVLPGDDSRMYQFDWSESPDSIWIKADNKQTEFEINFTAPVLIKENGINFHFKFFNFGYSDEYYSDPGIDLYRTCRTWEYKGWGDWGPSFGWSNWYWSRVDWGSRSWNLMGFAQLALTHPKDASGNFYQYKDEFHIKFTRDGFDWLRTINLPGSAREEGELLENNEFQIVWMGESGELQISRQK